MISRTCHDYQLTEIDEEEDEEDVDDEAFIYDDGFPCMYS
jgi:hypothetical protein